MSSSWANAVLSYWLGDYQQGLSHSGYTSAIFMALWATADDCKNSMHASNSGIRKKRTWETSVVQSGRRLFEGKITGTCLILLLMVDLIWSDSTCRDENWGRLETMMQQFCTSTKQLKRIHRSVWLSWTGPINDIPPLSYFHHQVNFGDTCSHSEECASIRQHFSMRQYSTTKWQSRPMRCSLIISVKIFTRSCSYQLVLSCSPFCSQFFAFFKETGLKKQAARSQQGFVWCMIIRWAASWTNWEVVRR